MTLPTPLEDLDPARPYASAADRVVAGRYERREADWRCGAVVYQVYVDRFAPSADLDAKRHLYPTAARLRGWDELPETGPYLPEPQLHAHEVDFWGGDLTSTRAHLDHVTDLGADVVYLNPVHLAATNHGYDALDYTRVAPWLGDRADVVALAEDLHARGLHLVLDGVFNHVGRASQPFRDAQRPGSPYRDWFALDPSLPGGARAWAGAANLPELVLENPEVFAHVTDVVRGWLRDGVDGWRLDVAFDIGFGHLAGIAAAAHAERPGSLVLGEIANYPAEWLGSLDGLLHFVLREVLLGIADGSIPGPQGARMLQRLYADADPERMLMSWVYLDNHDTPRLATVLPDPARRRLATVLQHTLPGSANLYYGSELGMTGGEDPGMRAPMRWDLVTEDNPWLDLTRRLVGLRRDHRALRVGDLRWLVTDRLIGFARHTDRIADLVVVLVNPADHAVTETMLVPDSKLMDAAVMTDLLDGPEVTVRRALLEVTLPAHGVAVLAPRTGPRGGYTPFKRVQ